MYLLLLLNYPLHYTPRFWDQTIVAPLCLFWRENFPSEVPVVWSLWCVRGTWLGVVWGVLLSSQYIHHVDLWSAKGRSNFHFLWLGQKIWTKARNFVPSIWVIRSYSNIHQKSIPTDIFFIQTPSKYEFDKWFLCAIENHHQPSLLFTSLAISTAFDFITK